MMGQDDFEPPFQLGDGMDCWASLATATPSPRKEVIHESHPHDHDDGNGQALRVGDFKLIYEKGPMWSSSPKRPGGQTGGGPANSSNLNDWWYPSGTQLTCEQELLAEIRSIAKKIAPRYSTFSEGSWSGSCGPQGRILTSTSTLSNVDRLLRRTRLTSVTRTSYPAYSMLRPTLAVRVPCKEQMIYLRTGA